MSSWASLSNWNAPAPQPAWRSFLNHLRIDNPDKLLSVAVGVTTLYLSYLSIRFIRDRLGETRDQASAANAAREAYRTLSGRKDIPKMTSYEQQLLADVVYPHQIATDFGSVGGMASMKRMLYESIILPLSKPEIFEELNRRNQLLGVPNGILFYGPPGTGKTLIAKAIAKTVNCTFINVRVSTLEDKWFGESQKRIRALFSLAGKLAPSIIFLDECESFMRKRGGANEIEVASQMRAEFLTGIDGLLASAAPGKSITVLACTNRPWDMDEAFLRRLPRTFFFDLPSHAERVAIFSVLLASQPLAPDVTLDTLAEMTPRYSGSDLKEVCKLAAQVHLRKVIKKHTKEDFERVMAGQAAAAQAKRAAEGRHAAMEPAASPNGESATPPASITPPIELAAASSSSSSSPAPSAASLDLASEINKPRAIRLADFRSAVRQIRPATTVDVVERLRQFEKAHRGDATGSASHPDEEEDDDEDEENDTSSSARPRNEPKGDNDDDEIYR